MLQAQRHDRGLTEADIAFVQRFRQWMGQERENLVQRLVSALGEREYLMACGRITQLDEAMEELEGLYRKYFREDEEDDDE